MITTARTDWINRRVEQMMLDDTSTVEIVEDIQAHGGVAHIGLCAALRRVIIAESRVAEIQALDDARDIVQAFAFLRASNEYDRRAAA